MGKVNKELADFKKRIRTAIADYIYSEGCSCCRADNHYEHGKKLGLLLNVKKYEDGSGYAFNLYCTKENP